MSKLLDSIPRHILQNILMGLPWIRGQARKYHSMGMGRNKQKILPILRAFLQQLNGANKSLEDKVVLELGPGQTPDLLFAAYMLGARKAIGCDVASYAPDDYTEVASYAETLEWLREFDESSLGSRFSLNPGRIEGRKQFDEDELYIHQYDGVHLPLADESIDILWSKSVLEHVKKPGDLIDEMYRVLKPGGIMCHIIDLRDHMTLVNDADWLRFLRYGDRLWENMSSNRTTWCNRYRSPKWKSIFNSSGLLIASWSEERQSFHDSYSRNELAAEFSRYTDEELSVSWVYMSAVKDI